MPMEKKPAEPQSTLGTIATLAGLATSLALGYLALSQRLDTPSPGQVDTIARLAPCDMQPDGYWRGRIYGATTLTVDWRGAALACAGNARPDGRGLRLFMAGRPGAGPDRLMLVVGIGAGIGELAGGEHPVSVTLVDEASSQFFHGPAERCFTQVRDVARLEGAPGGYRVEGELYCAGAISSVSGERSVTLGDMAYAVRLTLDAG